MSIAAISSSFISAVRASASGAPVQAASAVPALSRHAESGGRRHELVDAMNQVLGLDGEQSKAQDQAVFRFAHALMQDLRSIDGGPASGPGRGQAWGRREWSDLPQRIDALATAAAAPVAATAAPVEGPAEPAMPIPMPVPKPVPTPVPVPVPAPLSSVPAVPTAEVDTTAELPPQPNPITTTSAALHLMQVPTSRLLEAYTALRRAIGDQAEPTTPTSNRTELATLLERLAGELDAGATAELPAGSVLNLTA